LKAATTMSLAALYPLRFEPLYQYRLWGGRRLAEVLGEPLPGDGPIGEAWVLSDRADHPSRVIDGPLAGRTIAQLVEEYAGQLLGELAAGWRRFPLLLKFLDARDVLSVQVHPSDRQPDYLPDGETGKTEAWVVLEAGAQSRVYAGLQPGTTPDGLRRAVADGTVPSRLASFTPKPGDAVFLPAGTVHALGGDVVVFEVQQNSDVTFRLYDWDHLDPSTGQARQLHMEEAMACIDFNQGAMSPAVPVVEAGPVRRERLFDCPAFTLWRLAGRSPFTVGAAGAARVVVCLDGTGEIEYDDASFPVRKGDVFVLPSVIGVCAFRPHGAVTVLEVALPEAPTADALGTAEADRHTGASQRSGR
jgi:mannose-6-phosphate isomerase